MSANKPIYLVITPFFPTPNNFRGPYVYDQVRAIQRDGRYQVVVMVPYAFYTKGDHTDYEYGGIKVYRFTEYELPTFAYPGALARFSRKSFRNALKRIGISPADIAVAHGHVSQFALYALEVKRLNPNCKAVVQHHGYDVMGLTQGRFANHKWHQRRVNRSGARLCNAVDLNIGVSRTTLDYLHKSPGIEPHNEYVLYNGVDLEKFYPTTNSEKNSDIFRIGCIGNFWEVKDQITLLRAAKRLVDEGRINIRIDFIGSGWLLQQCKDYVSANGLDPYVRFLSEVDHTQLRDFYCSLDLFVLPSWWDAFGCVYTEAWACGVPFICAEGSGITELIPEQDRINWVIPPHDDARLAQLIARQIDETILQTLTLSVDINYLVKKYINFLENV